jgi:beta-glucosidase
VFFGLIILTKNTPQFPFGHGYSKFEYSGFELSSNAFAKGGSIQVSVNVKNTSNVIGKEVIQLYIKRFDCQRYAPVKRT